MKSAKQLFNIILCAICFLALNQQGFSRMTKEAFDNLRKQAREELEARQVSIGDRKLAQELIRELSPLIQYGSDKSYKAYWKGTPPSFEKRAFFGEAFILLGKIGDKEALPLLEKLGAKKYYPPEAGFSSTYALRAIYEIESRKMQLRDKINYLK